MEKGRYDNITFEVINPKGETIISEKLMEILFRHYKEFIIEKDRKSEKKTL